MRAYISVSFSGRQQLEKEVATIKAALSANGVKSLVFVDLYRFTPEEEVAMMRAALEEIDQCDMLVAETSEKGIGIGIEAGYAKAKGKPVIYVRSAHAEHSTTVSGLSDYRIIYEDAADLAVQISEVVQCLKDRIASSGTLAK